MTLTRDRVPVTPNTTMRYLGIFNAPKIIPNIIPNKMAPAINLIKAIKVSLPIKLFYKRNKINANGTDPISIAGMSSCPQGMP